MSGRELRLQALINRKVRDAQGRVLGRLEELRAEVDADDPSQYVIAEFHVGSYAWLEGIAAGAFGRGLARIFGGKGYTKYIVPWDAVDLTDPARPKLLLGREELPTQR